MMAQKSMKTKRIATMGLMVALAFILSYIEALLPLNIGIPGAKVGLANLAVMVTMFTLGERDAVIISLVRVILVGLTFGNMSMMMYSLAGAALSLIAMILVKKMGKFTASGISVIGGVFHNVGQIIVAVFVLDTSSLFYYLPFLVIIGCVTGVIIGLLASLIIARIEKSL